MKPELLKLCITGSALALISGCVSAPAPIPVGATWRAQVAWTEVADPHATCREFLREIGKSRIIADGCSGWRGNEFHIITGIIRNENQFYTVGHELGHGRLGRFHDAAGEWIIQR